MTLLENGEILGTLEIPDVQGVSHKEKIEALDSATFKVTVGFKAAEDLDSVRLEAGFVHASGLCHIINIILPCHRIIWKRLLPVIREVE